MNGFVMQKTNFPYVCCILDDCSTDGEQEVIKKYLDDNFDFGENYMVSKEETDDYKLIGARHKFNRNCFFAVFFLKYNHYQQKKTKAKYIESLRANAKYCATCEGDDYWIDSQKLQKQFDILESDDSISMCHHNFYELNERGEKTLKGRQIPTKQNILDIARYNSTQTLTMFYRNITPLIPDELKGRTVYSQFWTMRLAEFGDIYYIDEPMAVYRRHAGGIFGKQNPLKKLSMFSTNIDNMIYWYNITERPDVVKALKMRGRRASSRYLLHFLRRLELRNALAAYYTMRKYC
jgi:glycosyltransferase involved in cell wall biosynthesis